MGIPVYTVVPIWSFSLTDAHANVYSTFLKRKGGLFKKAHELSVLCSVDVAVFIFGQNKKLYEYSSSDMRELMGKYHFVRLFLLPLPYCAQERIVWKSSG